MIRGRLKKYNLKIEKPLAAYKLKKQKDSQ